MPLTKPQVDRLTFDPTGPATQIHYDDARGLTGFGVRVFPSGAKSFVVWYRTATGRKRLMTVGRYGVLTLDEGRRKAREELRKIGAGSDPLGERRAERQAVTVQAFVVVYLERHAKQQKKTWRADERRLRRYILPALGHHKLSDVTRPDVARMHQRIGAEQGKPYEANRALALTAVLFSKAKEWGELPEQATNPAKYVQPFPERSRDRFVTEAEFPALMAAIEAEPSLYVQAAFKLYLLTGMRRSELLSLKWSDVDLAQGRARLEETKAGRPHVVPLSGPAVVLLRALPRMVGNPYVFPGQVRGQQLVNVAKPWRRIRARLWLTTHREAAEELRAQAEADTRRRKAVSKHASERDAAVGARLLALAEQRARNDDVLRLHDLRRTVGSWLAMGGASLPLIGKVLNHSNASTTQIYARLAEDAPRAALEAMAERMAALAGAEGTGAKTAPAGLSRG